jgi:FkbM family methyltransferase
VPIKESIRTFIEKATGRRIFRVLPLGIDPLYDIQRRVPGKPLRIIFDVGANIGQSAHVFARQFPQSAVYCFEPSAATFQQLKNNLKQYNNISFHQLALGQSQQEVKMAHAGSSDQNRILKAGEEQLVSKDVQLENIRMQTLSGFCQEQRVPTIDYLKIDTEGFDLEVVKSGQDMLSSSAINFIEVEVGMNPANTLHVSLEEMKKYLESYQYYLFGIYEQVQEWKAEQHFLRRCNALFISGKLF